MNDQPNLPPLPSGIGFRVGSMPTVQAPLPVSAPKRHRVWLWILAGGTAAVLLCCTAFVASSFLNGKDPEQVAATAAATRPTLTTAAPSAVAPSTAVPSSLASTKPVAPPPKPTYKALSAREWKLIAKNPDSYIGKTYVVYGVVTQFDAATGDDTFRADISHKNMTNATNTTPTRCCPDPPRSSRTWSKTTSSEQT
ncbi:hypothetical protein [Catellatospora bangladeshensis]|uniref:Uncharacterized protein n=2 Tax=Catellatospora bangladeshensis TaxID=310355 RepID=A0A8J3JHE3_9ACTN|nr:hypothetical protein [Catellatospora bangladeshensis]GIF80708.1 hypothetical protein Cba03nite_20570 [Catellatospora bangladeshensis]